MPTLPPQPWAALPDATRMLAALGTQAGETRMVGGAVRDALLGHAAHDIDLATTHEPPEVARRLAEADIRTIPTGLAHGTLTALADGRAFEITTLRRDIATNGRHAEVAFTHDWAADAARRDFTINALSADPITGAVYDYHEGVGDLAAGRVRFIGDPLTRIAEDHLRILRFFRFNARFARGDPDVAALAACAARANDLMALSRERVRDEVLKTLAVADPVPTLLLMRQAGVLAVVLPDLADPTAAEHGLATLVRLVAHEAATRDPPDPLRRLAALVPADTALLDSLGHRLRLSTADRKRLATMAPRLAAVPDDPRALAWRHGHETARDLLLLGGAGPAILARLAAWERPRLPITGGDLVAAGLAPGPGIAARLRAAEAAWVASGFALTRADLLAL